MKNLENQNGSSSGSSDYAYLDNPDAYREKLYLEFRKSIHKFNLPKDFLFLSDSVFGEEDLRPALIDSAKDTAPLPWWDETVIAEEKAKFGSPNQRANHYFENSK